MSEDTKLYSHSINVYYYSIINNEELCYNIDRYKHVWDNSIFIIMIVYFLML